MNILSLTYEYPPLGGGGGGVAAALNQQLVLRGDRVRVVTNHMAGLPRLENLQGVEVHRTGGLRRFPHFTTGAELATSLWPAWRRAAALVKQERPDLIHAHFVLPTGFIAWRLARRFGIPFVLTAHGSDIPGYNPDRFGLWHAALRPAWRRIVQDAAAITSPSRFLARLITQQCPDVMVDVIPNGFAPAPPLHLPRRRLVLVVARLFPRKGVQFFLDAVQRLARRGDWEFVVAGDGPYLQTLREQARALGSPVRFIGMVGQQELRSWYQAARIFVFPSIRENFPLVLLEAMDAGCAVITTDAEGCAEVVGDAGIVVPAGNARAMAERLALLLEDDALCARHAAQARERSLRFHWQRMSEVYASVFRRVVHDDSTLLRALPAMEDA